MAAGSAKGPSRSIELRREPDAPTDWRACRLALMEEEFFQSELAACKESGRATGAPPALIPGTAREVGKLIAGILANKGIIRFFASQWNFGETRDQPFFPRTHRMAIGRTASAHRPRMGPSMYHSKIIPKFGSSPLANTSPRPAPTQV